MKNIERKYHLFDLKEKAMGRLATQIAKILSGRNKVDYTPHIDAGDFVVVVNSDELVEVTPKSIRLRKKILNTELRKKFDAKKNG
jgi:large subunit ribosomal protein L13